MNLILYEDNFGSNDSLQTDDDHKKWTKNLFVGTGLKVAVIVAETCHYFSPSLSNLRSMIINSNQNLESKPIENPTPGPLTDDW